MPHPLEKKAMKPSNFPLLTTMLCIYANSEWSEMFEVMKLCYSASGLAVYVRVGLSIPGRPQEFRHYWRAVADIDEKWEVVDTLD